MKTPIAFLIALFAFSTAPAFAQEDTAPVSEPAAVQVMFLGAYHFANPGLDVNNIETDNVLVAKRQTELEALGEALATFKPTVVAVEVVGEPPYIDTGYDAFTPEKLGQDPSEHIQIGYRVAYLSGLDKVHAINEQPSGDEPDYFPFDTVAEFAARTGREDAFAELTDMSALVEEFESHQETWTIPALLRLHNTDWVPDEFYWNIIGFGEGEDQPGAELAAYWFMRNAKIFNKLQQVSTPGDRVLVVYGSGHKAWLDELVDKTPGYELVSPLPYLDTAESALSGD